MKQSDREVAAREASKGGIPKLVEKRIATSPAPWRRKVTARVPVDRFGHCLPGCGRSDLVRSSILRRLPCPN